MSCITNRLTTTVPSLVKPVDLPHTFMPVVMRGLM